MTFMVDPDNVENRCARSTAMYSTGLLIVLSWCTVPTGDNQVSWILRKQALMMLRTRSNVVHFPREGTENRGLPKAAFGFSFESSRK